MSKKVLIGFVAIVVIVWFFVTYSGESLSDKVDAPSSQVATSTIISVNATTNKKAVVTKNIPTAPIASKPVSMSYQKALETYKEGLRLQLSGTDFCQVSPNNVTYKNGTSIMIDNRSPKTHSVKIGATYTLEGYGFKIIRLSSPTLPATLLVDCDTQQNVAKIILQK